MLLLFVCINIALAAAIYYFVMRTSTSKMVWLLLAGGLVAVSITFLVVSAIGTKISVNNALTYNEYWSGYELKATKHVTRCTKDGSCKHTYSCDPYTVTHTRSVSDGNGGTRIETYTTEEWHSCPYTTEEWTFTVDTTLGSTYTFASHVLPTNPYEHRYRRVGIPKRLVRSSGYPKSWVQVKNRLDEKSPGPVTEVHTYKNYILASQSTLFKKYSSNRKAYLKKKLLPSVTQATHHMYYADKFHVIEVPTDRTWQTALMRLNAKLGTERQGDLHMVAINATKVPESESDAYTGSLLSYWQGDEFKDDALSKNTIVVVVGVDTATNTVTWARARTGMPFGNEKMLLEIKDSLKNVPFTVDALFGPYRATLDKGKVIDYTSTGVLPSVLFGESGFTRTCMECSDKGDSGTGFSYLKSEVETSTTAKVLILITSLLLSFGIWSAIIYIHKDTEGYS